jgi:hypothetical protein
VDHAGRASAASVAGKFFGESCCNVHFEMPTDPNLVKIPSAIGAHKSRPRQHDKVVINDVQPAGTTELMPI